MALERRKIDPDRDRDTLLPLHCMACYASECAWARRAPYHEYEAEWLATSQPASFLSDLKRSMEDARTIAEFWCEDDGQVVGYLWAVFRKVDGYSVVIAEVNDIAVVPEYRRRGLGLAMLRHAEEVARRHGADLLRSGTGIENIPSQELHKKAGFATHRVDYERVLNPRLDGSA